MSRDGRIKHWEDVYGIDYTRNIANNSPEKKIIPCIRNILHKIPLDIFNTAMDSNVCFFILNDVGTMRWRNTKLFDDKEQMAFKTSQKFTIFLNGVHLRNKPRDDIEYVIAYELAHVIQYVSRAKNYDEVECNCPKGAEREADEMVEKWGFPMPKRWKMIREKVYKREEKRK